LKVWSAVLLFESWVFRGADGIAPVVSFDEYGFKVGFEIWQQAKQGKVRKTSGQRRAVCWDAVCMKVSDQRGKKTWLQRKEQSRDRRAWYRR